MSAEPLLIIGASARAACHSAARGGYAPHWIDLFGDLDLDGRFPGRRVAAAEYPSGMVAIARELPPAPFLYTGAMENHLAVVEALQANRTLLGNDAATCRAVRDPQRLASCLDAAGIPRPGLVSHIGQAAPGTGAWLQKPLLGAGGQGITHAASALRAGHYLQEFIDGEPCSAVFLADGRQAQMLGETRQLVGEDFLHAAGFAYCGSIGPRRLDASQYDSWQAIAAALVRDFGLTGLFGIDAVRHENRLYPVEVNPRYTASTEVLERALGFSAVALHCQACGGNMTGHALPGAETVQAKAYLFAPVDLLCPREVEKVFDAHTPLPDAADIPRPGSIIRAGHPLMTVFARAGDEQGAMAALQRKAELLYRQFAVV